jgi:hypothetical protein
MRHVSPKYALLSALLSFLPVALITTSVAAQAGSLRGQVTDQNGAIVVGAKVTAHGPGGQVKTATTDNGGLYSFANLPAGDYTIEASAPSLVLQEPLKVTLHAGTQTLNLQLSVFIPEQKITVQDNRTAVSTDAAANASAQVLRGEDLDALGDSPEDLQEALLALAGPSAGPSGGQIFIDGFSGGQIPSKNSIREIRINQNPFSPEYDKLGFGRIEILTKPGSGKFGGSIYYNFANQFWNSRNPYAAQKAPFMLHEYGGNLTGPINKRASLFLDVRRDDIDNGSIVNAVILDPTTLIPTAFTDTPVTPQKRFGLNPRIDYQINQKHTLVARYAFTHSDINEAGIGGFNLSSRAVELLNTINTKWNIRLSPFVVIQSGPPFDITIGRDLYGTTLFNSRPGIAIDRTKPGLIQTAYGLLDPNPTLNQPTLTRNFGRGPGQLMVNLRVQKIFEFGKGENSGAASTGQPGSGPRGGTPGVFTPSGAGRPSSQSAGHRYSLSISMSIRNIINHTNPGPIIGNITSPLFGQANQPSDAGGFGFSESANNRRLELQTRLTF